MVKDGSFASGYIGLATDNVDGLAHFAHI